MTIIAAEIEVVAGKMKQASRQLKRLGFRIRTVGTTLSVDAHHTRWREVFGVEFKEIRKSENIGIDHRGKYLQPDTSTQCIPGELEELVGAIHFVVPPELF